MNQDERNVQMEIDSLWDYDEPAGSESRFRQKLEETDDPTRRACLLTQIARAQGLQRRFDEAHATLDTARELLDDAEQIAHVRYLLERGRVHNSAGEPRQAQPLFLLAWNTASLIGADFYAIDAAHMLGIIGDQEEQIRWNERALEMAKESRNPRARRWQGSLYNNLGWTYHDLARHQHALQIFEQALALREEEAEGPSPQVQTAKWSVARALRSVGRVGEALRMQRDLLAEHEAAGTESGYVYEEIGECLLAQDRPDEAQPFLAKAYGILARDPWLAEQEPERLARLRELSAG